MRIVIDMQGAQTESRFRGIGRYTMAFVTALANNNNGHQIVLVLNGLFPKTIEPIRLAFEGLIPQEDIRVWYAPGHVLEEIEGNDLRREIAELIRESFLLSLDPDVIYISSLFEGYLDDAVTSIGRLDSHVPISVSLYDLIPLLNPDHYLKANPRYAHYYRRKADDLKKASSLLAISDFSSQEGQLHLGLPLQKFVNISAAIEPCFQIKFIENELKELIQQKFGLKNQFILYAGGADERKNLSRLIEAFAGLPTSLIQNHQLVFAGNISGTDMERFIRLAGSLGLDSERFKILGYVTDRELIELYNLCKLFVFPSWHEGFGLPVLEAMACGAAVIASNCSSLPEVVGLDEALFDPLDVFSIRAKIQSALEDPCFLDRLKKNGLQRALSFSWDQTAKKAIESWQLLYEKTKKNKIKSSLKQKPTLAFVSPLPPERTGIADYSAELLPVLANYYDLEIVVSQAIVNDVQGIPNLKIRDISWLKEHSSEVNRIIYHIGNSPFHRHMLELIQDLPGVVVLHDFFLSGLKSWMELEGGVANAWTKSLYDSHGYMAVKARYQDEKKSKSAYPVNLDIFQAAKGIIVHSNFSRQLANDWYEGMKFDGWAVIPHLRVSFNLSDKEKAKSKLGFSENDFVVCSFGFLDAAKLNDRLLKCWFESALSRNSNCHLVFVGQNEGGEYGISLVEAIKNERGGCQVKITGFVEQDVFRQYLMAADFAVQLRTDSRGETSGTILDCMNFGVPIIVNANGSMAELDDQAVWMLPENFNDCELIEAIETLWRRSEVRESFGAQGRKNIFENHDPSDCALQYFNAIEDFYYRDKSPIPSLISKISKKLPKEVEELTLLDISSALAKNFPVDRPLKCLFLDVTATFRNDLKTGIERVARAIVLGLLKSPPSGFRVEPVYLEENQGIWCHRYARKYTLDLLDCPEQTFEDEVIEPQFGDVILVMDLSGEILVQSVKSGLFKNYSNDGVKVYSIIYDLLPIIMPEVFPPSVDKTFREWLSSISEFNGAICISKAVADHFKEWLIQTPRINPNGHFRVEYVHLGADLESSHPSMGLPVFADSLLAKLKSRTSFLMVGTVEPRKGYMQVLESFDQMWAEDIDVTLVIVGKEGWKDLGNQMRCDIPKTVKKIRDHEELGKRLFWLEDATDEFLEKIYASCTCLIAASYSEGFGLPLIEAAKSKLPIIARNIPVFNEIATNNAYYFDAETPKELTVHIKSWLKLFEFRSHPASDELRWLTWADCVKRIAEICCYSEHISKDI